MRSRKIVFSVFSVLFSLALSLGTFAVSDRPMNWYCVRNKEHKQPALDADMRYILDYDGYYVDRRCGDSDTKKVVYLTFDAGYENGNVEKILDIMKDEGVKGAFFILGNILSKNPELVIRMADEGHTVCNHTYTHKDMTRVETEAEFSAELDRLNKQYKEVTGRCMSPYFRPPEGRYDRRMMELASSLGYKTVFWSIAYADWDNGNQPSAELAKAKIMDNIHNGAIILLHPTSATNVKILPEVIRELRALGYSFGTLDELTGFTT